MKKKTYFTVLLSFFSLISFSQNYHRLKVYFDTDNYQLRENEKDRLDSLLFKIKKPMDFFVKLDAHTDSDGTDAYNEKLSLNRGKTILTYLTHKGFPEKNIEISSFGEHQPEVENSSEENKQLNRRVRIIGVNTEGKVRIRGKILSEEDKSPLTKARIVLKTDKRIDTVYTNQLGEYDVWVPKSNPTYYLVTRIKNHFYHYEKFDTKDIQEKQIERTIELKKLNPGTTLKIPLFNFVAEKSILIKESEPNLRLLLETMRQNPNLKIEIHGHIDKQKVGPVPENSESYKLSVNRAKLVYNFLKDNGVSPERMKIKAFGNWKMLYPDTNDIKLQDLNRRVEIYIIEN